jgi:hypothetical protein
MNSARRIVRRIGIDAGSGGMGRDAVAVRTAPGGYARDLVARRLGAAVDRGPPVAATGPARGMALSFRMTAFRSGGGGPDVGQELLRPL